MNGRTSAAAIRSRSLAGVLAPVMFGLTVAPLHTLAQDAYPNRLIRLIVPTAPGAGNDAVARLIAPGLSERLGRQIVVENRAGAGTIIGTEIVVKERLSSQGLDIVGSTPEEFAEHIKRETARRAKVIKEAGIKAD